jgi:hypothetical protein
MAIKDHTSGLSAALVVVAVSVAACSTSHPVASHNATHDASAASQGLPSTPPTTPPAGSCWLNVTYQGGSTDGSQVAVSNGQCSQVAAEIEGFSGGNQFTLTPASGPASGASGPSGRAASEACQSYYNFGTGMLVYPTGTYGDQPSEEALCALLNENESPT